MIHFIVWDTGIGIAPQDQEKLFKTFVQLDGSLSRQYGGRRAVPVVGAAPGSVAWRERNS